jgi:hypothetical protein
MDLADSVWRTKHSSIRASQFEEGRKAIILYTHNLPNFRTNGLLSASAKEIVIKEEGEPKQAEVAENAYILTTFAFV